MGTYGPKSTSEEWIAKAKAVHGNRYDYSKTIYEGANYEVEIICPRHGSFFQIAASHLQAHGCAYCRANTGYVYDYIQKLNHENGWNLVGGNSEYSIPSKVTPAGRYRFDGYDKERLIFFEHNEVCHKQTSSRTNDAHKRSRLIEFLAERGLTGKATLVTFNAYKDELLKETL